MRAASISATISTRIAELVKAFKARDFLLLGRNADFFIFDALDEHRRRVAGLSEFDRFSEVRDLRVSLKSNFEKAFLGRDPPGREFFLAKRAEVT